MPNLPGTLATFALTLGLLASCNTPMRDQQAPVLASTEWVLPDGEPVPQISAARWRLLAFFVPN